MSLLLDAMKKNGAAQGRPELQLEDHPGQTTGNSYGSATTASVSGTSQRQAGETLFAAKKAPPKRWRWKLGFIPTVLLIAALLFAGGSYYVWLEIQPPAPPRAMLRHPPVAATPESPPVMPLLLPSAPVPPAAGAAPAAQPAAAQPAAPEPAVAAPVAQRKRPSKRPVARAAPQPPAPKPATLPGIERSEQADPLDTLLQRAYAAYQKGDYAAAAQDYRAALAQAPKNRDALLGLAATAQQQQQDDAAQLYYRQVLQLDPRDPMAHAGLAALGASDPATTESRLQQLLAQQPNAALYYALGNHYAQESRWSEAQQAYFNALALEPNNALFAYGVAISLDHLGKARLAAQHYQKALQLDTAKTAGFDHAQTQRRLNELTR